MKSSFYEAERDLLIDLIANKNSNKYVSIADMIKQLEGLKFKIGDASKCAFLTDKKLGITYLYTVNKDGEDNITPIYPNKGQIIVTRVFHIRVLADQITMDSGNNQVYNYCSEIPLKGSDTTAICESSNDVNCVFKNSGGHQYILILENERVTEDFDVKITYIQKARRAK